MRRLIRLILCFTLIVSLMLVAGACKRREKLASQAAEEDGGAPVLVSMIHMADPRAAVQLARGFYGVEANAWRWTMSKFSVVLRPPTGAAQKGATLRFKFNIPQVVMAQVKSTTLSASVNGLVLPPETYSKAGDAVYSRDVPVAPLSGDAVTVDFALSKCLPPGSQDDRELGVIAQMVGLEVK